MKRFAWLICVALIAGPGLWAQTQAPADNSGAAAGSEGAGSSAAGTGQAAGSSSSSSEDEFFGSAEVEAKQGAAETKNAAEAIEKERLGFSGQLQAQSAYTMTRDFVSGAAGQGSNTLGNMIMADFLVDARLPKSFRMFMDANIDYLPTGTQVPVTFTEIYPTPGTMTVLQNQTTILDIKEVFVDFNIANTVYFRAGKQVLQWGTGYFWNPTDLINVSHKSFTNLNALLDGTFGLRTDVTFSSLFHLYTFINMNGVQNLSDIAYAARAEVLLGNVEVGVAGWYQYNEAPVFGLDLSMPIFWELNLTGEASFSSADPVEKYDPATLQPYKVTDQLVSKVDIGLSRTFDVLDVQDRVTVMAEFFWNSDGYNQNMFQMLTSVPLQTFGSAYYHAGYYGQYYGALFVTINSFGLSNMALSLNGLANFSDMSAIALVGLSYAPISNFTLSLQVGSYLGADGTEYAVTYNYLTNTLTNNAFLVILGATVNF